MKKIILILFCSLIMASSAWAVSLIGSGITSGGNQFDDWGRSCALVIQSSQVPNTTQTNFPVLLDKDTLPSEIFDADGSYPALSGGGDIRFSSDSAGETQLACEVVTFTIDNDPANGVSEIWVKIPSISSNSNTTFYIWYHKSGESQPAIDSTYGAENVWDSNYKLVQHMNEDPSGSAPQMIDSTSNDNDGTSSGTMLTGDLVAGKIGNGLDFDGSDDYISIPAAASGSLDDLGIITVEILFYATAIDSCVLNRYLGFSASDIQMWVTLDTSPNKIRFLSGPSLYAEIVFSQWSSCIASLDSNTEKMYDDSVLVQTATPSVTANSNNEPWLIGTDADATGGGNLGNWFDGVIDEIRISNIVRSGDWIKTGFNNQDSPSTFIIEGAPS